MLSLKDSLKFEQSVGDSRHNLDSILTRLGQVLLHQQALNPSYPPSGYGSEERGDDAEASPQRMVRSVAAQTFTELREDSTDGQPSSQHPETAADQHRSCEQEPDITRCDYCEGVSWQRIIA
ncbi:unnamed protein product [Dibothriocephalus latus]|uniref:Uncharacterized protein n=1 Tax=Dibothriocephalus latus TaxID=60516 RepID=A0A3P7PWP8_DIBLA|nr:unnamed protein product [Dibothriocephalus latus]